MTVMGAWLASRKKTPIEDKIGLTLTVGAINGVGINTAHELGHKSNKLNKLMAMRHWRRPVTPTSWLSTILVITSGLPHRKTRPAAGWARVSGSSCRARCLVA